MNMWFNKRCDECYSNVICNVLYSWVRSKNPHILSQSIGVSQRYAPALPESLIPTPTTPEPTPKKIKVFSPKALQKASNVPSVDDFLTEDLLTSDLYINDPFVDDLEVKIDFAVDDFFSPIQGEVQSELLSDVEALFFSDKEFTL